MTNREKYEVYHEMYHMALGLSESIRRYYEKRGYKVYSSFVSVGNEETREYFVDIEVGGSPSQYNRIYGLRTEKALMEMYGKEM